MSRRKTSLERALAGLPSRIAISYARCEMPPKKPQRDGRGVVLSIEEPLPTKAVVVVQVSKPGWGFGDITIVQTKDGVFIDGETCTAATIKGFLGDLVDSAVLDSDMDPKRHKLYSRVTGRRCGEWCWVCHPKKERKRAPSRRGRK